MKTIITNGMIVLEDRILENHDLILLNDRIQAVCTHEERGAWIKEGENYKVISADGQYIMPGIIDIHSDMIENYIQPRSTAILDFDLGFQEAERALAMCGITTMFHSISMYRDGTWDVKEIRKAPQVRKLADLIAGHHGEPHLIRHRYHLRYEIDNIACYGEVQQMLQDDLVDLISFMDHTPGQGQYKNLAVYKKHLPNAGKDVTDEAFEQLVAQELQKDMVSFEQLKDLADLAKRKGISIASHDDDTIEKLAVNQELGVSICEFPITLEVAEEALKRGYMTVLGAPNILLGGSHSGNLSALDAIRAQAASVLVSDYYPQALLQAVFFLNRSCQIALPEAIAYVTKNPARAVGMDHEIGTIEAGKKADLLIVDASGRFPAVSQVFVGGECIMQCHYRSAEGSRTWNQF